MCCMAHLVIRQHTLIGPVDHTPTPHEAPRPFVIISHVATGVSLFVLAAALMLGVLARTSGTGAVRLFGHEVRPVLSGSMTPAFRMGDAVITDSATPERLAGLAAGDVIVFRVPGHESMVVAHRVARVTTNNRGERMFTTKGDANSSEDSSLVDGAHVIGVVTGSVPYLGRVMMNLGQRRTLFVFLLTTLLAGFSVTVARLARQQALEGAGQPPRPKAPSGGLASHPSGARPGGLHKSVTSAHDTREISACSSPTTSSS